MHRIIYLSSGIKIFSDEEINDLLKVSRNNNEKNGITGLLLYSDGNFIQILEGEKEAVVNTYKKIVNDVRHRNIILVISEPIKKRNFKDWKMGFSIVDNDFLEKHPEINPFNMKKNSKIDAIISVFIDTFLNSFRNRILYN
jgi:hypothetical protein